MPETPIERALAELQRTVSATPAEIEKLQRAIERLQPTYATGGYITGPGLVLDGGCFFPVHPDECFIRRDDVRDGRPVCSRPGHPTATSDCSTAHREQCRCATLRPGEGCPVHPFDPTAYKAGSH